MAGEAEQRIVGATIALIEREGVDRIGIREIAAEAKVNSAAISYYFRSKENLVKLALAQTLKTAFGELPGEWEKMVAAGMNGRDAFETLLAHYISNATKYPRVSYAHLRDPMVNQEYDGMAVQMVQEMLSQLATLLGPSFPDRTNQELRLGLAQIWAAILTWAMLPQLFSGLLALDFNNPEHCRQWARQMMRLLEAQPEKAASGKPKQLPPKRRKRRTPTQR